MALALSSLFSSKVVQQTNNSTEIGCLYVHKNLMKIREPA